MTDLFIEDDVVHLRNLGWFETKTLSLNFTQESQDNEALLLALNGISEEYDNSVNLAAERGMYKQIRDASTRLDSLKKALDNFNSCNFDSTALAVYGRDLVIATESMERLCRHVIDVKQVLKGKHDTKVEPAKDAAKHLIDLWASTSGEPPTQGKGARYAEGRKIYPAGKCFTFVLDKLTETYGGSIKETQLMGLLKIARKNHKEKVE